MNNHHDPTAIPCSRSAEDTTAISSCATNNRHALTAIPCSRSATNNRHTPAAIIAAGVEPIIVTCCNHYS